MKIDFTIDLFGIDIDSHATSCVSIFEAWVGWRSRALFYIQWFEGRVEKVDILFTRWLL